ncbi:ribonuclease J [Patescibacteria group bacterium]|nr:ribonuclease J [Patescibacteria group bacterium]
MIKKNESRLRVIPISGFEEVGRNMMVIEYDHDIIIIDMGLQFPEEEMHGIDYIIPNIGYLKGREQNIRGVIITHGHLDHVGGIPHLIPKLGNPTLFATKLTRAIIEKRQLDYKNVKEKLNCYTIDPDDKIKLGIFKIEFFRVNHNIPDGVGVAIHTPEGTLLHTGDFKFDHSPVNEKPVEVGKIARLGAQGILALFSDSTNAEVPGYSISEKTIAETLDRIIAQAPGRVIIGTFSTLISRIQQTINIASKYKRKIVIEGYSMKTTAAIAQELGYLKVPKGLIIDVKESLSMDPKKVIIMCTGAQGEDNAVLMRIANKEHRFLAIEKNDTVIFSSSVIPGNEATVQRLKDSLSREGAHIVHYKLMDVHTGGHGHIEDLKMMLQLTKPKYFIPIHGNRYFLQLHANIAESVGIPKKNCFVANNGQIMEYKNGEGQLLKKHVPASYVFVDGLGEADATNIVLRDRQHMANDGMLVVIASIEVKTGKLIGNPDIISRGFVYLKENKKLIEETRSKVKKILIDKDPKMAANETYLKKKIRDGIGQFLFQKTEKRPMVLPVIIDV